MPAQLLYATLRAVDSNGDPVAGAQLTCFESGTTTPLTVYTTKGLDVAHPTPILADAAGVFPPVWLSGANEAKVEITDASGAMLDGYPMDPVPFVSTSGSAASEMSFAPVTGNEATNVQGAIENLTTFVNEAEGQFASSQQGLLADQALPRTSFNLSTDSALGGANPSDEKVVSEAAIQQALNTATNGVIVTEMSTGEALATTAVYTFTPTFSQIVSAEIILECTAAYNGFQVGDLICVGGYTDYENNRGAGVFIRGNTVQAVTSSGGFRLVSPSGAVFSAPLSSFSLRIRAYGR